MIRTGTGKKKTGPSSIERVSKLVIQAQGTDVVMRTDYQKLWSWRQVRSPVIRAGGQSWSSSEYALCAKSLHDE